MGSLRPARTVLSVTRYSTRPFICAQCRPFHSTPSKRGKRRPVHSSIKAVDMGLIEERISRFQPYTEEEKAILSEKYTPEQMEAIEAGESSISAQDLATQGAMRDDEHKLPYISDLSTIDPVIDHPVAPRSRLDPQNRPRPKSEQEISSSLNTFLQNIESNDPTTGEQRDAAVELQKFLSDPRNLFESSDPEALLAERPPQEPLLPKLTTAGDTTSRRTKDGSEGEEEDPHMTRLIKQTGLTKQAIRRLRVKSLVTRRVTNQTRMGKIQSAYHLTIAGDLKGMLGIGEGKATEDADARRQASMAAIRNMKPVPRYEERTIFGEVMGKVGAVELRLSARPPGRFLHWIPNASLDHAR